MTDEQREDVLFLLKNLNAFLGDFFAAGNHSLQIDIAPHDCATGLWFEAKWIRPDGRKGYVSSMYQRLMYERLIIDYLSEERRKEVQNEQTKGEGRD